MHDDDVGLGQRELVRRQAIVLEVLAGRRQQRALHPLALQPQHHDDVAAAQALGHIVEHAHAERLDLARQQRFRSHDPHLGCAERGEAVDQRARDARMKHVADHGHRQVVEVLLVMANRVEIEQALRRVRMAAVARVDDVHVAPAVGVQVLRVHRDQVVDGVEQRFTLARRRHADVEVDDVGGQALGGDFERRARARRILEKQVEHGLAAQQRDLFHFALGNRHERIRGIENVADYLLGQALQRQQVRELAVDVELGIAHDVSRPRHFRRRSAGARRLSQGRSTSCAPRRAARRSRLRRSATRALPCRPEPRVRCAPGGRNRRAH